MWIVDWLKSVLVAITLDEDHGPVRLEKPKNLSMEDIQDLIELRRFNFNKEIQTRVHEVARYIEGLIIEGDFQVVDSHNFGALTHLDQPRLKERAFGLSVRYAKIGDKWGSDMLKSLLLDRGYEFVHIREEKTGTSTVLIITLLPPGCIEPENPGDIFEVAPEGHVTLRDAGT